MQVITHRGGFFDAFGGKASLLAGQGNYLRSPSVEFRGSALVRLCVGEVVTQNSMVGLAEGGQDQGIGGRAIEDEEDLAISLKKLPNLVASPLRPSVVAVAGRMPMVTLSEDLGDLRADARVVVAGEVALPSGSIVEDIATHSACRR